MSLKRSREEWETADGIQGLPSRGDLQAENARLTARIEELEKALKRAERALKPFAARVFNDNHDITVSDTYTLTIDDYSGAYFAHKEARSTLLASDRNGETE